MVEGQPSTDFRCVHPLLLTSTKPCGSEPARDDFLSGDRCVEGVHIHFCGNGHLGFRPYGGSLLSPKVTKGLGP